MTDSTVEIKEENTLKEERIRLIKCETCGKKVELLWSSFDSETWECEECYDFKT